MQTVCVRLGEQYDGFASENEAKTGVVNLKIEKASSRETTLGFVISRQFMEMFPS